MAGWFGLPGQSLTCSSVASLFQIIVLKAPSLEVESISPVGGRLGVLVKRVVVTDISVAGAARAAANRYGSHYNNHFP